MNLKESFNSTRKWKDADAPTVLQRHIDDVDSDGQLERANAKIARLTEVVGRLIEYVAKNDQQALDLVGSWHWELDK